jgi:hypothetical protein
MRQACLTFAVLALTTSGLRLPLAASTHCSKCCAAMTPCCQVAPMSPVILARAPDRGDLRASAAVSLTVPHSLMVATEIDRLIPALSDAGARSHRNAVLRI